MNLPKEDKVKSTIYCKILHCGICGMPHDIQLFETEKEIYYICSVKNRKYRVSRKDD